MLKKLSIRQQPTKHLSAIAVAIVLAALPIVSANAAPEPFSTAPNVEQTNVEQPVIADPQAAPTSESPFNTRLANNPSDNLPITPVPVDPNGNPQEGDVGLVGGNQSNPAVDQSQPLNTSGNTANPTTLASELKPSTEQLSAANKQLLTNNARLQRQVGNLETRVNVLINERSGQLFMYGAVSVIISIFLGFVIGWFVFGRRDNW